MSFSEFLATISLPENSLVANNRFRFQLISPPRIRLSPSAVDMRLQSIMCRVISIPSVDIDSIVVDSEGGLSRTIPKSNKYAFVSVEFLATNDFNAYNFFSEWSRRCGSGTKLPGQPFADMNHAYYNDIIGSFNIVGLDRQDRPKEMWTFNDVWPMTVTGITYDVMADIAPQNFEVNFVYNSFDQRKIIF